MLDTFVSCGTRREGLVSLSEAFESSTSLRAIVGKSAIVDCALLLYAQNSPELMNVLSKVMDTDELLQDIQHVQKSADLRRKKREMLG